VNSVIPYELSSIVTPVSAFGGQADQHTVRWAKEIGLVRTTEASRRLAATSPGMLAAHCYPTAVPGDLCLLADWMTWLFTLDDHNDEGSYGWDPESLERALTSLFFSLWPDDSRAPNNPLEEAFVNIVSRVADRMPEAWLHRFLRHVINYFDAYVRQAAHRRGDQVPDLDVFAQLRRDAGAIMPSFDLVEFVEATMLPASLYYSRTYQRLLITAADVVCWTNDLMTFEKEIARGDNQNLVVVAQHALGFSLERSIDYVDKRAGQQVERFVEAEAELDQVFDTLRISDPLRKKTLTCVTMLKAWMRGHVDWGRDTARYLEFDRAQGQPGYLDDLLAVTPAAMRETRRR
jgi:hypothetical protein